MKLRALFCFFLILAVAKDKAAYATHIFGGELLYKHLTGNDYKVILTMYGDCAGASFPSLNNATPQVVLTGNGVQNTLTLTQDTGSNIEVTPVCPSQAGHTTCSVPQGTVPGVKRYIYSTTVTLSGSSANWQFKFTGNMGNGISGAGRSSNITNISSPGNLLVYLVASLNNTTGDNSSPVYTTIPTPFYCVNVAEQYNQGAIDPDNDSLSFSLLNAIDGGSGNPCQYMSGFSGTHPVSVVPGLFTFNSLNGQMNFTPNATQDALIVSQVSEYRNGVLVGSSMRELTFIVFNNCLGNPPRGSIDTLSITGGSISHVDTSSVNVCLGSPDLAFDILTAATSGDTVSVTINNPILNSTITVTNNNTNHPLLHFHWPTAGIPIGAYNFFITLKDNHCPVADVQTNAYTINIVNPFSFSDTLLYPTQCIHQAYIQYNVAGGFYPASINIKQGGSTVKIINISTAGIVTDSLPAGNYTAIISSLSLNCSVTDTFSIVDSGTLPVPPIITDVYCKNDPVKPLDFPIINGAIVTWHDMNGNLVSSPNVSTSTAGTYHWYIRQQYHSCSSSTDTMQVVVHDLPQIGFPNVPTSVCLGDTLYLIASGGVKYKWESATEIFKGLNDSPAVVLLAPGSFTVFVTNQYGCIDSSSFSIGNVEPCCVFSYPNAFTPNHDGKNDFFHVIVYGHTEDFELQVFNRWGQLVFHSKDQYRLWDGTFEGVPCPIGTYSYFITSKCLSGKKEFHKGDVILIR